MITRTSCRVCEGAIDPLFSLGDQYVSDFPGPGEAHGTRAPLDMVLCRRCRLLQLKHTVPAEAMYRNYWYRSGTNSTMTQALADISRTAERLAHLRAGETVLDIGCNDGTLLASYRTDGLYKIGFDPAKNLVELSSQIADRVVNDFFQASSFLADPAIRERRPRIVTSIAMFYDLEDPRAFVSDVKTVMHADGLWIIQMSYLPLMLKVNAFDNICHEHLEYYSLHSLEYLLRLSDFEIVDVELNDVNGGSLRAYIRNKGADQSRFGDDIYRQLAGERVRQLRDEEITMGLENQAVYAEFAMWVDRIKQDVSGFIRTEVAAGKKVYVYGASTKGNTLLQYFGLDSSVITAAAERNPQKWGKVTVGTNIPIVSEEEARRARPDYFLVLPWHFIEEFKRREMDYLSAGGRFILPAPHFALV